MEKPTEIEIAFMLEVTVRVTMPWPSRTIGELYSEIYSSKGTRAFHRSLAQDILRDDLKGKVYLHRLKRLGWAHPSQPHGRGMYRLLQTEACVLIASGKIKNIQIVKEPTYSGLVASFACEASKIKGLRSLVLYGSVARGEGKTDSDVDLLGILDDQELRDGFDYLTQLQSKGALADELSYLRASGVNTQISFLPMSVKRFCEHPFILLDIVTDGLPIIDDGTYMKESLKIKRSIKNLHAKRIFRSDDDWYWDLLPRYSPGAKVTI